MLETPRHHPVGFYLICVLAVMLDLLAWCGLPRGEWSARFQDAYNVVGPYRHWIVLLVSVAGGWLADRFGAYRALAALGFLMAGVGMALVPADSERAWTIIVPLVIAQVGNALAFIGLLVMLGNLYPRFAARKDQAFLGLAAVLGLASLITPIVTARSWLFTSERDAQLVFVLGVTVVGLILFAIPRALRPVEVEGGVTPPRRLVTRSQWVGIATLAAALLFFITVFRVPLSSISGSFTDLVRPLDPTADFRWLVIVLPWPATALLILVYAFRSRPFTTTRLLVASMLLAVVAIAIHGVLPRGYTTMSVALLCAVFALLVTSALGRSFLHRVTPFGRRGLVLGLWIGVLAATPHIPIYPWLTVCGAICLVCAAVVYRRRRLIQAAAEGR